MLDTTNEAAQRLYQHMVCIFEEVHAEDGKEWVLWDALARYWSSKCGQYQPPSCFPQDITEYMADLDTFFRQAEGWIWWVKGPRGRAALPRFVSMDRWLWLVTIRGGKPHLTNEEINRVFPDQPSRRSLA
jgi:hypothetical protein